MLIISLVFVYLIGIVGIVAALCNKKMLCAFLSLSGIVIFAWICSYFEEVSVSMGTGGYLIGICSVLLFAINLYGIYYEKKYGTIKC